MIIWRPYSRLAQRLGVKSFDDHLPKRAPNEKKFKELEGIDQIKQKERAQWFIPLVQLKIGDLMPNINIFKDGRDPILQPEECYPAWIWDSLTVPLPKEYLEDWEITTRKQLRAMNHFRIQLSNSGQTKFGRKGSNPFKK